MSPSTWRAWIEIVNRRSLFSADRVHPTHVGVNRPVPGGGTQMSEYCPD